MQHTVNNTYFKLQFTTLLLPITLKILFVLYSIKRVNLKK